MIQSDIKKPLVVFLIVFLIGGTTVPVLQDISLQHHPVSGALYDQSNRRGNPTQSMLPPTPLTGLAPHLRPLQPLPPLEKESIDPFNGRGDFDFYAYSLDWPLGYGPVTFDEDAEVQLLQSTGIEFISGSDFDYYGNWYGVNYYGGLYQIDPYTGTMTFIADTIPWLTSMVIDRQTGVWYVSSPNGLLTINIETGQTTPIGLYGISTLMISIMSDWDGNMFGYDVVTEGNSSLYSINTTTGAATKIGDMGYPFCYAQEGKFDRFGSNVLYLATYTIYGASHLASCDPATGDVTFINEFSPYGIQIDGFVVQGWWLTPGLSVKDINAPVSGNAGIIAPEVVIANQGWNDIEDAPVNMKITKDQITTYMDEDFTGVFPPAGWDYINNSDYWTQSYSSWAGGTSPEAMLSSSTNEGGTGCLKSVFVNTSSATVLTLSFRSHIWWGEGPCNCTVEVTGDGGTTWNDVSPWPNPMIVTLWPWLYLINISAYIGPQTGLRFAYSGQTTWLNYWMIDDVRLYQYTQILEYNQTQYVDIPAWEIMTVTLPGWSPGDLGAAEGINVNYTVSASTEFPENHFPMDFKQEHFILHYGFFYDVAVTEIISPVSGPAEIQTPIVVIENPGQLTQNVNVSMSIGKALYTTLMEEDFTGSVPPAGWGTNYPGNWMSSSTNYAGGEAPEAMFSWTPSSVGEHLLYTDNINTTGYTALLLQFKEYVNDYNGVYTLKVVTSTDGGATWSDAYVRTGGPYGPTTTEITLTATNGIGSAIFMIAWDMSGNSCNINNWYIDDVQMDIIDIVEEYNKTEPATIHSGETLTVLFPDWTPVGIPFTATGDYLISASIAINTTDGNPADNEIKKLITLSYEHDIGVIDITQYPGSGAARDIIWDNYADDGSGTGLSSQLDLFYPFNSQCADDFQFTEAMDVNQVHWWGAFWNGGGYPNPCEFNVIFYDDDGGMPTGAGMDDPTSTALAVYNFPAVTGVSYGTDKYEYDVTIDPAFVAYAGVKYWVAIQAVFTFSSAGQWGWSTNGENPDHLSGPVQGFPLLGTAYWTPTTYGDHAFQLSGTIHQGGGGNPPPGTYPIAGIIQNHGITYTEVDISVNAVVTNDTGVVVYDETIIVAGPLAPGQMADAIFPDIIIPWGPAAEHNYKLTMRTMLPEDDHPENDPKTQTWVIQIPDTTPPITTATLSGTMGNNGWYIGPVQLILTATDGKWPLGVNHTYIKFDSGSWMIYTAPYVFESGFDGQLTILFYSDDKAIPPNIEDTKQVSFKIDMSPPVFTEYTFTPLNLLKDHWLCTATVNDATSGIFIVEFYVDNAYIGNDTTAPYEFEFTGKPTNNSQAIAYDSAGNSALSPIAHYYEIDYKTALLLQRKEALIIR